MKMVLKDLGCEGSELSVLFTDDDHISELNRDYRSKKGPTNVLSFPMSPESQDDIDSGMLGDIVISIDTAKRESEKAQESLDETIDRLLIHGLLHLLGFDHEKSLEEEKRMQTKELKLLEIIQQGSI